MKDIIQISSRAARGPVIILVAAGFLLSALVVDRIVAVVGKEVITERELDLSFASDALGLMRSGPLSGSTQKPLARKDYLGHMIERMVIEQEVKRQGVKVDALEVEQAIDRKMESLGLGEEEFLRALALQAISLEEYREQVKEQLITFRLVSQEVRGEIEVTEEEIRSYYIQHPGRFMGKNSLHLRHIFMPFPVDGGDDPRQKAVNDLEQIKKEIEQGADFGEKAKQWSKSPTASSGGDLGWFTFEELMPEFREQVKKLEKGRMSPVFVHGKGVHLILLEQIKPGKLIEFEKVHNRISDIIFQEETMQRYDLWLVRLKAGTHIENRLKKPASPAIP